MSSISIRTICVILISSSSSTKCWTWQRQRERKLVRTHQSFSPEIQSFSPNSPACYASWLGGCKEKRFSKTWQNWIHLILTCDGSQHSGALFGSPQLSSQGDPGIREEFIIFTFFHYFPQTRNNIYIMETLCWLTGWKTLITPPFGLKDQIRSFCARGNE